jgi:hypothetical protein
MNNKRTLVAVSAAILVGAFGIAPAALANDAESNVSSAQAARESHENPLPWWWNAQNQAAGSYAYQPIEPSHTKDRAPKK